MIVPLSVFNGICNAVDILQQGLDRCGVCCVGSQFGVISKLSHLADDARIQVVYVDEVQECTEGR